MLKQKIDRLELLATPRQSQMWRHAAIVLIAARTWRRARDTRMPVQPALFATLAPEGYGLLAPVIDSVMRLWEVAFAREMRFSSGDDVSRDERMLLGLLDAPSRAARYVRSGAGVAIAFDNALRSTRIMMNLTALRLSSVN